MFRESEKQILEITSLFKNLTWKSVTLKSLSSPYVFKKLMAVCASEQSIDVLQQVTSGRSTNGGSLTVIILMLHRFLWLWLYQQLPSEPDLLLVCCNIWKHMAHCTEDTAVRHLPTAILKKVAMWSSSRFTSVFSRLW